MKYKFLLLLSFILLLNSVMAISWYTPIKYDIYNNTVESSKWTVSGAGYSYSSSENLLSVNVTEVNNGNSQASAINLLTSSLPNVSSINTIAFRGMISLSNSGVSTSGQSCGTGGLVIFGTEVISISSSAGPASPCSSPYNNSFFNITQNLSIGNNVFDVFVDGNFKQQITATTNQIYLYLTSSMISGVSLTGTGSFGNITYTHGSGSMDINITYPPSGTPLWNVLIGQFNSSMSTLINGLKNSSLVIDNVIRNSTTRTGVYNTSSLTLNMGSFSVGSHVLSFLICDNSSNCAYTANRTFLLNGFQENGQSFSNTSYPGATERFLINVTYSSAFYTGITAYLNYNNTNYSVVTSGSGDTRTITKDLIIPSVTYQVNNSFYWIIGLSNSSGTTYYYSTTNNQTVNPIRIDNCTSGNNLMVNLTLKDEITQAKITGNSTIEVLLRLYNRGSPTDYITYNFSYNATNPAYVCITPGVLNSSTYGMDSTIKYTTDSHVTEYNNLQNYTMNNNTIPLNINLLDLDTTNSQEFLVNVLDGNYLALSDALITIQRLYVSEATYKTVESVVTDPNGNSKVHLDLTGVIYTIIISKQGRVLYTLTSIQPYCDNSAIGDCRINIQLSQTVSGPTNFDTRKGISYNFSFDTSTRTVDFNFIVTNGDTKNIVLNVTRFDSTSSALVCTNSLSAAAGTVSCTVPVAFANSTLLVEASADDEFIANAYYTIGKISPDNLYGLTKVTLILFLYMTLVFMGIGNHKVVIVMGIAGLIIAGMLNLLYLGSNNGLLGVGSAIIWFILAGGILIWKASNRQ